ncbi:MAG TPA: ATP-binding protein, partial [Ktedonobacteraceae bacterium]|nr:ATP-binding protein [Ktedonobacteraceae bacterium]
SSGRVSSTTLTYVVSVATRITNDRGKTVGVMVINLSLDKFTSHLHTVLQRLSPSSEVGLWIIDYKEQPVATTSQPFTLLNTPLGYNGLMLAAHDALQGKAGNLIAHDQSRDWLYSYVTIPEAGWAIVVQRPTDVTFAALTDFQHGLIAALALLILGASFFWLMMHRRIIAPLSRLAKGVSLIQPNQPDKVMHTGLLVKDRDRQDEIGNLVTAFSVMEAQIRSHFLKSDATIQSQFYTLDALMRSIDEGVLLESPDGLIVYANHVFSRAVGIPLQDLMGSSLKNSNVQQRLSTMLDLPENYREVVEPALRGRRPRITEFQIRGSYSVRGQFVPARRDIRMRLFHVRDAKGILIGQVRIFQDITEQNEAERIKRNLLAIVSHELRTPLTAIKGFATSLLEEADGEVDVHWQQYSLGQIVVESNRMADLVTNLLDMAQVEAGTLKLYPELHSLKSLLEDALAGAPGEQDHIQICLPEEIPLLYVDRRRIQVVLRNLLENARRYGGPAPMIEISATYTYGQPETAKQAGLTVHIADTGPGIPIHLTDRVFDRFYQVESGRERSSSGVGLGLAICRGFVEAHGGRIWAENRADGKRGAIFHVWLPPSVLHIQRDTRVIFDVEEPASER